MSFDFINDLFGRFRMSKETKFTDVEQRAIPKMVMRVHKADKTKMITAERVSLAVLACVAVAVGCVPGIGRCSDARRDVVVEMPLSDNLKADTVVQRETVGQRKPRVRKNKERKELRPRSRDYLAEPAR